MVSSFVLCLSVHPGSLGSANIAPVHDGKRNAVNFLLCAIKSALWVRKLLPALAFSHRLVLSEIPESERKTAESRVIVYNLRQHSFFKASK